MSKLSLVIVTPQKNFPAVSCDSVHLSVCGGEKSKNGGSYGIRKGHAKAVFSLCDGVIEAKLEGKTVFSANCGSGFAIVENNRVTATVDECTPGEI